MDWRIDCPTGESRIFLGPLPEILPKCCPAAPALIVTDAIVRARHGKLFPAAPIVELPPGESGKTLDTVQALYEQLLAHGCDRGSPILAIGGGVVCDTAGFAASTWLRGVPCGYVPTTLLAQVDAAIGGKTGVNLHGYKNLIGTFRQPRFVICDPAFLTSLPPAEFRNGMAEAIKHAAIADADYFAFLEAEADGILALDGAALARLIGDSIAVKTTIVNRDAIEAGERRLLNYGHTIGHALEKTRQIAHGEAVALGMVAAARLSVRRGLLSAADAERLAALLARFGLPTQAVLPRAELFDAIAKDKKRLQETLHFVLLEKIGRGVVTPLRLEELAPLWDEAPQR